MDNTNTKKLTKIQRKYLTEVAEGGRPNCSAQTWASFWDRGLIQYNKEAKRSELTEAGKKALGL